MYFFFRFFAHTECIISPSRDFVLSTRSFAFSRAVPHETSEKRPVGNLFWVVSLVFFAFEKKTRRERETRKSSAHTRASQNEPVKEDARKRKRERSEREREREKESVVGGWKGCCSFSRWSGVAVGIVVIIIINALSKRERGAKARRKQR